MGKCNVCRKTKCKCSTIKSNPSNDKRATGTEPMELSTSTPETTQTETTPDKLIAATEPPAPVKGAPAENVDHVEPAISNEAPVEMTNELYLRFTEEYMNGFAIPSYSSVAVTAMAHFQQQGMICKPMRVDGDPVFKLVLRNEVPKEGQELEFSVAGKSTRIPLYAFDREKEKQNRREGTLITFKGAGEGPPGCVGGSVFDKELESISWAPSHSSDQTPESEIHPSIQRQ